MTDTSSDDNAEYLREFVDETNDQLVEVEGRLLELEQARAANAPFDREGLDAIFRGFHSMKGTGGFLGLDHLVDVTHRAETILDRLRNDELALTSDIVTVLCNTLDFCREAIGVIERDGNDKKIAGAAQYQSRALDTAAGAAAAEVRRTVEHVEPQPSPVVAALIVDPPLPPEPAEAPKAAEPAETERGEEEENGGSIRVDVAKLDMLMNIVGELILVSNATLQEEGSISASGERLKKSLQSLARTTRSLQEIATRVRMTPVRGVLRRMRRVVRDAASRLGKEVDLEIVGENTEVDKNLVQAISDPLVHLIRNSVDHGVESPAERVAAGKPARGHIRIEASHRAGEVWIVIEDDGKGIDKATVVEVAIRKGLISAERGAAMSDSDAHQLIFAPGFSTKAAATSVSGRGVGMDVVKRNVEALSGRVDVASTPGVGTRITLRVPLTLAIIDGMLFRAGSVLYIVPTLNVRELIHPQPEAVVSLPTGDEVLALRGLFIPITRLADRHGHAAALRAAAPNFVILESDTTAAIPVDTVVGQQQCVVKALPETLGDTPGLAGCTILGDGTIGLILDPRTIVSAARA